MAEQVMLARARHGGREGRRKERDDKGGPGPGRPYIARNIPTYDILGEESLIRIEDAADRILAEVGIDFRDDLVAIDLWRKAGAELDGLRVRFPKGMLREILRTAPTQFTQHARKDRKSTRLNSSHIQKSRMPSSA